MASTAAPAADAQLATLEQQLTAGQDSLFCMLDMLASQVGHGGHTAIHCTAAAAARGAPGERDMQQQQQQQQLGTAQLSAEPLAKDTPLLQGSSGVLLLLLLLLLQQRHRTAVATVRSLKQLHQKRGHAGHPPFTASSWPSAS